MMVSLGDTFFRELSEGLDSQSPDEAAMSQPTPIEAQQAAEDLKSFYDVALTEEEAEKVSHCYYIKCFNAKVVSSWPPS